MSWDWEKERDLVVGGLRQDVGFPIGPLELADQMHLNVLTCMVIERISRVVYGRGTGRLIGFIGDVESDQRRDTGTEA